MAEKIKLPKLIEQRTIKNKPRNMGSIDIHRASINSLAAELGLDFSELAGNVAVADSGKKS